MCIHPECKKGFSFEFLLGDDEDGVQRFSNKFVWGPLKEHREDIFLDRIMARLPTFQQLVTDKVSKERYKEKTSKIEERLRELHLQNAETIRIIIVREEYGKNEEELYKTVDKNRARIQKLEEFKRQLYLKNRPNAPKKEEDDDKVHKIHGSCLRKSAGCNGFINHEWECGVCFTKVCSKCHCLKLKDHECDQNEVESIKALKEISKACPGCNQMIERTYGCNLMWCLNCHNFFQWETLKLIKKTQYSHNPEHIAWLAKNNKTLGNLTQNEENVCDVDFHHIRALNIEQSDKDVLNENLRVCNEIRDDIETYRNPLENNIEKHAIDFLRGKITKVDLKKLVQRNYKSSKKSEFANMHRSMYIDNVRNVLIFSINEIKRLEADKQSIDDILQNTFVVLDNSREYTENNLKNLGALFNSEKPHLSNLAVRSEFNSKKYVADFLKYLHRLRTGKFQLGNGNYKQVLYKVTKVVENTRRYGDIELIEFLKANPAWIPSEEDILMAKKEVYDDI